MSRWIDQARALVAHVHSTLPEGATLVDRRKALRAVGPGFHGGTYWGRKIWGRVVRKYLEKHGQKPRAPMPLFAADIAFPFRGNGNG